MQPRVLLFVLLGLSILLNTIGIVRWNAGAPYDTAHKGLETIEEVLQGNIEPFYRHYNGQPPFMDWFLAAVFLLFGVSAYTLHSIGIVSGILTTLLLYLTGKVLWSHRAGLYASAFGTTSHWFLLETREGTHNIPLVPLLLFILWCFALVYQTTSAKKRYAAALAGGVAIGLLGYIYAAGWIFLILLFVAVPVMLLVALLHRSQSSQRIPLALMLVVMSLVVWPFIQFTVHDSQSVLIHADDEIRTREPLALFARIGRHFVSNIGAFTYLIIPPFSTWEGNSIIDVAGIPLHFPVPFVSPITAFLLITSMALIIQGWLRKEKMFIPALLILLLVVALVPNLMTIGPQPHYRRTVCAMVPLFLLVGWAASYFHNAMAKRGQKYQVIWQSIVILALLHGPVLYFLFGIHSAWFDKNYHLKNDRIAPALFARVAAGQRVTLAGTTSHLKSFQFYALATPQGRHAFHLIDRHTTAPFPASILQQTDVLFYVYPECEQVSLTDFLPPRIVQSQFGIDACVFDRPSIAPALREKRVELPSSGPLLSSFFSSTPPLEPHQPFHGPIYGFE